MRNRVHMIGRSALLAAVAALAIPAASYATGESYTCTFNAFDGSVSTSFSASAQGTCWAVDGDGAARLGDTRDDSGGFFFVSGTLSFNATGPTGSPVQICPPDITEFTERYTGRLSWSPSVYPAMFLSGHGESESLTFTSLGGPMVITGGGEGVGEIHPYACYGWGPGAAASVNTEFTVTT